jgi:glycosyltransferase involved in cell wall biosynthesis
MPSAPEPRRILFLQVANPAAYPPTLHAAELMAAAGWRVTLLAAPIRGSRLTMRIDPGVQLRSIGERPSHVIGRPVYARYLAASARLALSRPHVVYASDPVAAGAGLLAARIAGARLIYHEHDSPAAGAIAPWILRLRQAAAKRAELVVLPNADRAAAVGAELGVADKAFTVWNLPTRRELPRLPGGGAGPLRLYYHGSITPDRLPEAVVAAVQRLGGRARLSIAGYEAPGARGYVARLVAMGAGAGEPLVEYLGEIPDRDDLLARAAEADLGLGFMPKGSSDLNMRYMVGASNKAFDYMAAGLPLLVSDLPDWRDAFVENGYGRACDAIDAGSVAEAIGWFLDHPDERRAMASRARRRIEQDWNYDAAFAPVLARLAAP